MQGNLSARVREVSRWFAARLLFVMSVTFSLLTWVWVGQAAQETDYRLSVIMIAVLSLVLWAAFMAVWLTGQSGARR